MANHQNKILSEVGVFQLVQRKKADRKWYEVKCNMWTVEFDEEEEIKNFFDPFRNRGNKWNGRWKYKNLKEAEQMFLTATLKWAK